jgi:hypothetical protein
MIGEYNNVKKIVAIGDLHGDILQLITILLHSKLIVKKKKKKCISSSDYDIKNWKWIGGKTHLVQLGDIFDGGGRGNEGSFQDEEVEIYNFLSNLKKKAKKMGGNVILIMGNHEIMNFKGNYNYVQKNTSNKCLTYSNNSFHYKLDKSKSCLGDRDKLFAIPNGPLSKSMSKYMRGIVRINNNIFCHGGISLEISKKFDVNKINKILYAYLTGTLDYNSNLFQTVYGSNGIIWFREFSKSDDNCGALKQTLKNLKSKRMIVGHTPQKNGITNYCKKYNESVWAIDVGLSRAFNTKLYCQYLVIENNMPLIKQCNLLSECK